VKLVRDRLAVLVLFASWGAFEGRESVVGMETEVGISAIQVTLWLIISFKYLI